MRIKDKEWDLTKFRLKCLEIRGDESKLNIYIYPLENGLIPYAFVLDIKKLQTSCEQVEVVEVYGDALIEMSPLIISKQNVNIFKTKKISVAGEQHSISYCTLSPMQCKIENGEKYVDVTSDRIAYTFDYVTSKNKVMIYAKNNDGYTVSLIDLASYSIEFVKDVMLLEKTVDSITTLSNMYDCHHHGLVERYTIGEDFAKKHDIVYIDGKEFGPIDANLVPYAFMDAVHSEDYVLSRKYLSPELSSRLDRNHLKAFFGEFEKIDCAITEEKENGLIAIYNENGKKYAKIYYFDIDENGRITNINEK